MEEVRVETTVAAVELYRKGCTIVRRGMVALPEGTSQLLVDGLPLRIDEGSIALRMSSGVTQGQVRIVRGALRPRDADGSSASELGAQIDELDRKIENLDLELEAWRDLAKKMGGSAALEYLELFPAKVDDLTLRLKQLNDERRTLSSQRDRENARLLRPHLEVEVSVPEAGMLPFELSYRCDDAGWKPSYDVLVDRLDEPLRLRMKAVAWQRTGEDWKDVALRLSTGTSAVVGDLPRFVTRYLSKYEPQPAPPMMAKAPAGAPRLFGASSERLPTGSVLDAALPVAAEDVWNFDDTNTMAPLEANVQEQATVTTYELPDPQSLATGAGEQTLVVKTAEIPATYYLYAYPRREQAAYLVARLDAEPAAEVLENPVSVYIEGSYVGSIRIGQTGDENGYELPLGRDDRVRVVRTEGVERSKRLLGSKVSREYRSHIVAESHRQEPIRLVVLEQIPVSRDKEIEVVVREISGAQYDAERGELRWECMLDADERVTFEAAYVISHAKGIRVNDGMVWDGMMVRSRSAGFCPTCGTPIEEGQVFCLNCGARLSR